MNEDAAIATLADWASGLTYRDLPDHVAARVKLLTLDTIGAMLAAAQPKYTAGWLISEHVRDLGGKPESTVIGRGFKSSCVNAALAGGTLGYYCDIEAHHVEAILHGPAAVVPSAIAVGERVGASGAELLAAIALGLDVGARTSLAIGPRALYRRGLHPSCIAGAFGVAAAAAHLLRLEPARLRIALGLAGTQASGLLAWETDPSEHSRPFNPGIAARNGVTAALLASQGFGGPPDIYQGKFGAFGAWSDQPEPELLIERLGRRWHALEFAFKLYACCAFLHPGLDALLSIVEPNQIAAEQVEACRLRFPRGGVQLIDGNPLRSHCGQYILPIALLERKIVVDDILVDRRGEPAIAALTPRVHVLADDELDPLFPAAYATIVELETRDGRRYRERVDHALGTLENPVPPERIEAKFVQLAGPAIGDQRVAAIEQEVAGLDRASSLARLAALIGG
ncbi:MAG TPA: MmgE/PrpD family protein [Chloroflexota bacterium]